MPFWGKSNEKTARGIVFKHGVAYQGACDIPREESNERRLNFALDKIDALFPNPKDGKVSEILIKNEDYREKYWIFAQVFLSYAHMAFQEGYREDFKKSIKKASTSMIAMFDAGAMADKSLLSFKSKPELLQQVSERKFRERGLVLEFQRLEKNTFRADGRGGASGSFNMVDSLHPDSPEFATFDDARVGGGRAGKWARDPVETPPQHYYPRSLGGGDDGSAASTGGVDEWPKQMNRTEYTDGTDISINLSDDLSDFGDKYNDEGQRATMMTRYLGDDVEGGASQYDPSSPIDDRIVGNKGYTGGAPEAPVLPGRNHKEVEAERLGLASELSEGGQREGVRGDELQMAGSQDGNGVDSADLFDEGGRELGDGGIIPTEGTLDDLEQEGRGSVTSLLATSGKEGTDSEGYKATTSFSGPITQDLLVADLKKRNADERAATFQHREARKAERAANRAKEGRVSALTEVGAFRDNDNKGDVSADQKRSKKPTTPSATKDNANDLSDAANAKVPAAARGKNGKSKASVSDSSGVTTTYQATNSTLDRRGGGEAADVNSDATAPVTTPTKVNTADDSKAVSVGSSGGSEAAVASKGPVTTASTTATATTTPSVATSTIGSKSNGKNPLLGGDITTSEGLGAIEERMSKLEKTLAAVGENLEKALGGSSVSADSDQGVAFGAGGQSATLPAATTSQQQPFAPQQQASTPQQQASTPQQQALVTIQKVSGMLLSALADIAVGAQNSPIVNNFQAPVSFTAPASVRVVNQPPVVSASNVSAAVSSSTQPSNVGSAGVNPPDPSPVYARAAQVVNRLQKMEGAVAKLAEVVENFGAKVSRQQVGGHSVGVGGGR